MTKRDFTKFPKEFKKKKLHSIDVRFLSILFVSLVFHVTLILFLEERFPGILQAKQISQIQKSYANLILDKAQPTEQILPSENLDIPSSDVLATNANVGPANAPETPRESVVGPLPSGSPSAAPRATAESRLPTVREMAEGGGGGAQGDRARSRSVSDVASKVGNIGLLGILTTGSGQVSKEYINSITDYGDVQNANLGQDLAKLDAMKVSRGPSGRGWKGTDRSGNPAGGRVMRGSRRRTSVLTVDDLLGTLQPQGKVSFKDVERVKTFQKLMSSVEQKPPVPKTAEEKERLRRKPDHVMSVINKHRPAVTDCYKILLRTNPNVRGKIDVRFAINSDGRVSWVEIVNSTIQDQGFQNCVMSRIRNWNDFGYGDPTSPDEIYRQVFTFGY
ncbi:MAG: AgmX/PglI C-terminal domain-containing protein [Calditrichaeota bacterium]|nr:AgmX/PglI C-terminal domain-containing protein [Calditrichota bacterium]